MKKIYFLFILLITSSVSFGQIIYETFSYADGSLTSNADWTDHSGTTGDLLVASGEAVLVMNPGSEDANIPFSAVTGNIYYAFNFSVDNLGAPYSGTDNEYFASFRTGFNLRGRIDITAAGDTGDFRIGIATNASSADSEWASDLAFETTYKAVVRYDQTNGESELWIDPLVDTDTSILGASIGSGDSMTSFALRQANSSEDETIRIDNLNVSTSFSAVLSVARQEIVGFSTYPNPVTNGEFSINSSSNSNMNVQIFDMLGKQVYSKIVLDSENVQVSNLNAGIYILRVEEEGKTATRKLVIE